MPTIEPAPAPAPAPGARRRRRAAGRRAAGLVLLAVGLAVLVVLVGAAVALVQLREHAGAAADHVGDVQRAVDDRDTSAALTSARAAAAETGQAQDAASSLALRLLSPLPVAGPLVTDVRALVGATDLAVAGGAVPLLEVVDQLDAAGGGADGGGLVRDGAVDVAVLQEAAGTVAEAAAALRTAQQRVAPLEPAAFPEQVRSAVTDARAGIGELAARADAADSALAVLPAALGAEGPRSYLVVFQNPAEARPTGGLVGTWALVAVDQGRAALTGTGSNDDLVTVRGSAAGLPPELQAIYGTGEVALQNVNLSPDFAVAGQLLSRMWSDLGRPAPDGIVAVDPQGMAPLLVGRGDVAVPGGPAVNADTVVDVLLSQVYADFADDNAARKEYLSTVVGTVFADALGGGALEPRVLAGLVDAGRGGHLLAWSPREAEQSALVRAGLSGTLPPASPGAAAVYLTNVDASKLDYFLTARLSTLRDCAAGAPQGREQLELSLTNDAPASVPEYVDNKLPGRAETTHTSQVALYLPPGRGVEGVTVDGAPAAVASGTEGGWSWLRLDVDVVRGASIAVAVQLTGDVPVTEVRSQPLVNPLEVSLAEC